MQMLSAVPLRPGWIQHFVIELCQYFWDIFPSHWHLLCRCNAGSFLIWKRYNMFSCYSQQWQSLLEVIFWSMGSQVAQRVMALSQLPLGRWVREMSWIVRRILLSKKLMGENNGWGRYGICYEGSVNHCHSLHMCCCIPWKSFLMTIIDLENKPLGI